MKEKKEKTGSALSKTEVSKKPHIKGGFPFYGQAVGVLVFNQQGPRVPGDPGNNFTFQYPVCYEVINGSFSDLIQGSDEIKSKLIHAVDNLYKKGIRGIIGDCGLMALYQAEMAEKSGMVVLSSALVMIPLVWQLIGRKGSIGILTGHSDLLSEKHLRAAGWNEDIKITIQGMQDEPHFTDTVIRGNPNLDVKLMRRDVLNGAEKLIKKGAKHWPVRAIILECSNLATYSTDVYREFEIPVFDISAGADLIQSCVQPRSYI